MQLTLTASSAICRLVHSKPASSVTRFTAITRHTIFDGCGKGFSVAAVAAVAQTMFLRNEPAIRNQDGCIERLRYSNEFPPLRNRV